MSIYRTSAASKTTYYSYASRLLGRRLSWTLGAVAWSLIVVVGTLMKLGIGTEWGGWVVGPSMAVLFVVSAWRWHRRRRVLARAGFREGSPE